MLTVDGLTWHLVRNVLLETLTLGTYTVYMLCILAGGGLLRENGTFSLLLFSLFCVKF